MPLTFTPLPAPCPGWFFSPHILPACFSFKTLISLPNYVPPVPPSSNSLKSPGSGLAGWGLLWENELPQFIWPRGGAAQKSPLVWLLAEADSRLLKRDPHQEADIPPLPPPASYTPRLAGWESQVLSRWFASGLSPATDNVKPYTFCDWLIQDGKGSGGKWAGETWSGKEFGDLGQLAGSSSAPGEVWRYGSWAEPGSCAAMAALLSVAAAPVPDRPWRYDSTSHWLPSWLG